MTKLLLISLLAAVTPAMNNEADKNKKAYPPAEDGRVRCVLNLPKQEDESLCKVEIIVGKTVETDKANQYFFGGKIERTTIQGWGYPRYDVKQLGPMAGTLMAVHPDQPKVKRFVALGGEPYLIRYNSRLPVVVYVPKDAEVRYRIWRTDKQAVKMDEG